MVAFLGPLLSAGVSGAGILAQLGAQRDQRNLGYLQLYETRRANRERERLAKATRSDALGNEVRFTPGLGFQTITTPMTAQILNAMQREERAQLTEDAPRMREAAERRDVRSRAADDEFGELFKEFRNRSRPNREVLEADARRRILSSRDRGRREAEDVLARQALRMGNSGSLGRIAAATAGNNIESLDEALGRAVAEGREAFGQELALDQQEYGNLLQLLAGLADGTTTSPVASPTYNQELSGRQDNALSTLLQTLGQNTQAMQSAYGPLMRAAGQSPNFGPLASALGRLNFGGGGGSRPTQKFSTVDIGRRNEF